MYSFAAANSRGSGGYNNQALLPRTSSLIQIASKRPIDVLALTETHHFSVHKDLSTAAEKSGYSVAAHSPRPTSRRNSYAGIILLCRDTTVASTTQPFTFTHDALRGRALAVTVVFKDNSSWNILCIYAPATRSMRPAFFKLLTSSLPDDFTPDICIGDFNVNASKPTPKYFAKFCHSMDLYDSWKPIDIFFGWNGLYLTYSSVTGSVRSIWGESEQATSL